MSARTRLGSVYICITLLHRVRIVGQVDRVADALAHLLVVDARQARHRGQQRLHDQHVAVEIIESADGLARELQVRDPVGLTGTNRASHRPSAVCSSG
jgi:hypothetical protein